MNILDVIQFWEGFWEEIRTREKTKLLTTLARHNIFWREGGKGGGQGRRGLLMGEDGSIQSPLECRKGQITDQRKESKVLFG